jgi:hypothetical protein
MTSVRFLVSAGVELSMQSDKPIMCAHITDDHLEFVRGGTIVDRHTHGSALFTWNMSDQAVSNMEGLRFSKYVEG